VAATFTELLRSTISNAVRTTDFRASKAALFSAAIEALPELLPLNTGSTASNPIQVLDFFSGAGGTSLGFSAINHVIPIFHFVAGCDINPVSAATYSRNFGTPLICEDILKITDTKKNIRAFLDRIGFDKLKPTVLIGCAPCQGFSSHRKKHWDDEDDNRNSLVIAFSRIVAEVNPNVFIMENVPEVLSYRYWGYFS
jgi:DNA (cytosine-5)-methyltransferase 1